MTYHHTIIVIPMSFEKGNITLTMKEAIKVGNEKIKQRKKLSNYFNYKRTYSIKAHSGFTRNFTLMTFISL